MSPMSPLLLALSLVTASATPSKIGVVVVGDTGAATTPAGQILAACPALFVVPISAANTATAAAQIRTYKAACPSGKVVVQVGGSGLAVSSGVAAAQWPTWFALITTVATSPGVTVDGVEGPWEPAGLAADVAAFWSQFAQSVSLSGWTPVIGAFAPGLPDQVGSASDAACPIIDAVRQAPGVARFAVSFHVLAAATVPTTVAETDPAFAFARVASDCGLGATVPIFVTSVLPAGTAWSAAGATWLVWFARQLATTSSVVGAAAFALGTSGGFDLTAIATQLVAELTNPSDGGGGGGGGGSTSGVVGPSYGVPSGELSPPKQGCATGGSGAGALLAAPLLLALRRRFAAPRTNRRVVKE